MPDRPRRLYAYQQAVRRQLDTQVAGFSGERTGVIELAFNRVFNLPNITVDIRPAGPCRLGIALPGRFTVTFRFSTAAFRRVLAVRRAAKQIANFIRLFRSLSGGLLLGVRSGFGCRSFLSGGRFLLCLGGGLLLGFRCGFFSASAAAFFSAASAAFALRQPPRLSSPLPPVSWRRQRRPLLSWLPLRLSSARPPVPWRPFPLRPSPWRRRLRRPSVAL